VIKKKKNFVAIIPARGGSKELKGKNIKKLLGHPLIAYSIIAAQRSKYISQVYVSTDNKKIALNAKKYGAKIIDRPINLATSTASSDLAVLHGIKSIENQIKFDHVLYLQVTCPLREEKDIDKAIELYLKKKADCLFTSIELHADMWKYKKDLVKPYHSSFKFIGNRSNSRINVVDNGSFYITNKKLFKKFNRRLAGKKICSYRMKKWTIFDIDNKNDFEIVEWLLASKKNRPKKILLI
jgi:N-acylneuraminate cytidylyltransferase